MFKKIVYLLSASIFISMVMIQTSSAMDMDIDFDFDEGREWFRAARFPVDPVANLLVSRMLSRASDEEDEGWSIACCETWLDLCNYSLFDPAIEGIADRFKDIWLGVEQHWTRYSNRTL